MRNDDPMYVRHLESALEAAEIEIKGLEGELREQDKILQQLHEQLNPTHMGEPLIVGADLEENRLLRALLHEWHGMFVHCRRDGTEGADLIDRTGLMLQLADMMTPQGKVGAHDTATLRQQIRSAQIAAGEDAVTANLRSMGLA